MESNYVCSNSDAIERNGSVYSSSAGKLRYLRIIFMVIAVPVLVISLLLEIVSNAKHKMVSKKKPAISQCIYRWFASISGVSKRFRKTRDESVLDINYAVTTCRLYIEKYGSILIAPEEIRFYL